jgi:hypothetical protein
MPLSQTAFFSSLLGMSLISSPSTFTTVSREEGAGNLGLVTMTVTSAPLDFPIRWMPLAG